MRLRHAVILAMTVVGSSLSAQTSGTGASSTDVLPFKATETTLPNGLKVIVVPTGFPNLVSIDIPVQTGSRNEVEPGKSGFAHFFEHLMFRGTPKTPPERYREIMTKAGARDNAGTGDDSTHYYSTFAKEDLENMPNEYEYSKLFFQRWYRPQFSTVIVAGDVTPEQVLPLIEKYWSAW